MRSTLTDLDVLPLMYLFLCGGNSSRMRTVHCSGRLRVVSAQWGVCPWGFLPGSVCNSVTKQLPNKNAFQ